MSQGLETRRAMPSDRDALRGMQALSLRTLGASHYAAEAIEAFLADIGTMDDALLDEGLLNIVLHGREIVACGGWSRRVPAYERVLDEGHGVPSNEPRATVRSVFVHPAFVRRGLASGLMTAIEDEIAAAGFTGASLAATLSGAPLYRRLGWREGAPVEVTLAGGHVFSGLLMTKGLPRRAGARAA